MKTIEDVLRDVIKDPVDVIFAVNNYKVNGRIILQEEAYVEPVEHALLLAGYFVSKRDKRGEFTHLYVDEQIRYR